MPTYDFSKSRVTKAVSEHYSLLILDVIDTGDYDSNALMSELRISRKRYYNRISNLVKVGMDGRTRRCYRITLFGRLISNALSVIEDARLTSVDSLIHD